jgi:hypothetical protein
MVNEEYFNNIADLLSDEIVTELNNLLILDKSKNSSG